MADVSDALSAFREEERCIGPGIGEVRADVVLIDTHGILRKRGEDRFANPFSRPFGSFPMPRLDAIVLVKEVTMGAEGIQVADLIGAQAALAGDDDHAVVARGRELLLIVADVLQAYEVVELEQLITREDEALLFLIEHVYRVIVFEHRLLNPSIPGNDGLDLQARNVGIFQDVLEQAAQGSQIAVHGTWPEPGIDKPFAECHNALPSQYGFHGLPKQQLPLAIGMIVIQHHEALEPARKIATLGLDSAVAVVAGDVGIQVPLQHGVVIYEHLRKRHWSRVNLEVLNKSELRTTHISPSFKFNHSYFCIYYLTQVKLVKWVPKALSCA